MEKLETKMSGKWKRLIDFSLEQKIWPAYWYKNNYHEDTYMQHVTRLYWIKV